ncbi:MAG: carboxypeptidase regulatory-like domain-containing protein, partial [Cyclobacteriaceae bacterium]|nr:carboxypeptidase regulatory-like domain-containing protein [Cyclobacteriaceae bacterium]
MATLSIQAQVTTSSMAGSVKSTSGESLSGATVKITHLPTGTTISAATAANGRYNVSNIQPGGPYTVEVSFVGYKAQTKTEIYLDLGETGRVDFSLISNSQDLKEVVVTGSKGTQFVNGGVGFTPTWDLYNVRFGAGISTAADVVDPANSLWVNVGALTIPNVSNVRY